MNDREKQAVLDGQMAALRNASPSDNPHPLNTSHSRAWARGYRSVKP